VKLFAGALVLVALCAACTDDPAASTAPPTAVVAPSTPGGDASTTTIAPVVTLTTEQAEQAEHAIRSDPTLASIVDPAALSVERLIPSTAINDPHTLDGVAAIVGLPGPPRELTADLPGWECVDGRFRGGLFRTRATNVTQLTVFFNFERDAVVAITAESPGDVITSVRVGDSWFPDDACQEGD
jgi:hypothetical protein